MLPSIWRSELLHPMTVHFPIALLLVASLFYVLSVFFSRNIYLKSLRKFSFLLIIIGTISAWAAVYTGGVAEEIVGSTLCDPAIRLNHENLSYYVAYIFSVFCLFFVFSETLSPRLSAFFMWLNVLLAIGGTTTLGYTAHLGAELTYQQAAGVYNPGPECKGFE